jgi:hypothetical protein
LATSRLLQLKRTKQRQLWAISPCLMRDREFSAAFASICASDLCIHSLQFIQLWCGSHSPVLERLSWLRVGCLEMLL